MGSDSFSEKNGCLPRESVFPKIDPLAPFLLMPLPRRALHSSDVFPGICADSGVWSGLVWEVLRWKLDLLSSNGIILKPTVGRTRDPPPHFLLGGFIYCILSAWNTICMAFHSQLVLTRPGSCLSSNLISLPSLPTPQPHRLLRC